MTISGSPVPADTLLQAIAADALNILVWMQTKDGRRGRNRPKSIVDLITKKRTSNLEVFDSVEEFEKRRKELINEVQDG